MLGVSSSEEVVEGLVEEGQAVVFGGVGVGLGHRLWNHACVTAGSCCWRPRAAVDGLQGVLHVCETR